MASMTWVGVERKKRENNRIRFSLTNLILLLIPFTLALGGSGDFGVFHDKQLCFPTPYGSHISFWRCKCIKQWKKLKLKGKGSKSEKEKKTDQKGWDWSTGYTHDTTQILKISIKYLTRYISNRNTVTILKHPCYIDQYCTLISLLW